MNYAHHPQMNRTLERLDSVHRKLLETVSPLDEQLFAQSPSENQWSISQIVRHLCLVEERVIGELEKELAKPPRKSAKGRESARRPRKGCEHRQLQRGSEQTQRAVCNARQEAV